MGNYISCTLAPPLMKNAKAARVIFPTGEVKQFKESVKAAEIMLDCPNYFVANSRSLHIGRRFFALSADEELEFGNVYILFPMRRVNSIVTAADVAAFFMAANSAAKRISGRKVNVVAEKHGGETQVSPADAEDLPAAAAGDNGVTRLSLDGFEPGFQHRLSYCRSRRPVLETINEEPICLR